MSNTDTLSRTFFLTAGESDAEGLMPPTLLASRVIEVATDHANELGIGYATLIKRNIGWVLSRLSMEVYRYPRINETYTLKTWIETYNRRFSERNFVFTSGDGEVLGYMRTVWVPMDFARRTVAELSQFGVDSFPVADIECPMAKTPRIGALPEDADSESYVFRYCDLDFNRHVNTVRYLDLILNHWPLEHYDTHTASRIDLLFHHECHFGEAVELRVCDDGDKATCEIIRPDGMRAVAAAIEWKEL